MSRASDWQIDYAAALIRRGGVIAYAAESVWGLGCDPYNHEAVKRLLMLKQRSQRKGLILLSGDEADFDPLLSSLSVKHKERFRTMSSRAVTWLLPDPEQTVPFWIRGEHSMAAVRVTTLDSIVLLTRKLGHPLVSTSANPSGRPTARNSLRLNQYFSVGLSRPLAFILPGAVQPNSGASMIKNILTNEIVRA